MLFVAGTRDAVAFFEVGAGLSDEQGAMVVLADVSGCFGSICCGQTVDDVDLE